MVATGLLYIRKYVVGFNNSDMIATCRQVLNFEKYLEGVIFDESEEIKVFQKLSKN